MIIEKLAQFLSLNNDIKHLPQIQRGICNALAHYYLRCTEDEWNQFIAMLLIWDGSKETLNSMLARQLIAFHKYVKFYQLGGNRAGLQYLGDNLDAYLQLHQPSVLYNPWHAIAINPLPDGQHWCVYDPNSLTGPVRVSQVDLRDVIKKSLGDLIGIGSSTLHYDIKIADPDAFIGQGGLLTMSCFSNWHDILSELIKCGKKLSGQALEGLLLRDLNGIPAWIKCLSRVNEAWDKQSLYAHNLLEQFIEVNPHDWADKLQKSAETLSVEQRRETFDAICYFLDKLYGPNYIYTDDYQGYLALLFPRVDYTTQFKTWETKKHTESYTLLEYCHCVLEGNPAKKRLIELHADHDVLALGLALQNECKINHRPVYYARSPDDLICSAPYVTKEDGSNNCNVTNGPGGPLVNFMRANQGQSPIIFIDDTEFSTEDLIRFNSILDKTRIVDGEAIPEDATIIWLSNVNKPHHYQGSDFYSRFDQKEKCPISSTVLENSIPVLPFVDKSTPTNGVAIPINLFNATDWESRLLGRVVIHGDTLSFEEGLLEHALRTGTTIDIQNGPWQDTKFKSLWYQALLNGYIEYAGHKFAIPHNLQLQCTDGYNWMEITKSLRLSNQFPAQTNVVVNPHCLGDLFGHYISDSQYGGIDFAVGIIEKHAGQELVVNVTRTITKDDWAMVLSECQKHHVRLIACLAPDVEVPEELIHDSALMSLTLTAQTWDVICPLEATQIMISHEAQTTLAVLTREPNPERVVIDVSECNASDLLYRIDGHLDPTTLHFTFQQTTCALIRALEANQQVILKGHFSKELADELASIILDRQRQKNPLGQLICICDESDAPLFNYSPTFVHEVTNAIKLELLPLDDITSAALAPFIDDSPLNQLKARLDYLVENPGTTNSDDAWLGLYDLPNQFSSLDQFDAANSVDETIAFTQNRKLAVNLILERAPYVFLTGISGVGKSTFVENELCDVNDVLYVSESKIQQWASDRTSGKRKILFLDEANLSKTDWSMFEGLFHNPPGVLINGAFYPLTPEHKVIFAGNPLSLGDERKLSPLFKDHGNTLVFEPLPLGVIYNKILEPVFDGTLIANYAETISQQLLSVYQFLCVYSKSELLISPRELQMIALLVVAYYTHHPDQNISDITQHMIWEISEPLVPPEAKAQFYTLFMPGNDLARDPIIQRGTENDLLITPSRQPLWHQLRDLLALHELRCETRGNDAQNYGGLGGIVVEGAPATGKSELILTLLQAQGYEKQHDYITPSLDPKGYYCIPASMGLAEKEVILHKAFHEGAIVVIDEINACPMMEKLLNSLLMGKTPENERPKIRPGFMIIGTQNPVSMAGRRPPSNALARRLTTIKLPDYSADEAKSILKHIGLAFEQDQEALVSAYMKQAAFAKQRNLNPAPTFRDLLRLAENMMKDYVTDMTNGQYFASFPLNTEFTLPIMDLQYQMPMDVQHLIEDSNLSVSLLTGSNRYSLFYDGNVETASTQEKTNFLPEGSVV